MKDPFVEVAAFEKEASSIYAWISSYYIISYVIFTGPRRELGGHQFRNLACGHMHVRPCLSLFKIIHFLFKVMLVWRNV
jgi:hypothetical protein